MFEKDTTWKGLLIGFGLPILLYAGFMLSFKSKGVVLMESTHQNLSLFIIVINGIVTRYFMINKEKDLIGRGIMIATFILLIVWVVKFHLD